MHTSFGQKTHVKTFIFGTGSSSTEAVSITSEIVFNYNIQYGFDLKTSTLPDFYTDAFTANSPVYFSVKLPEGNYKITLVLGSDHIDSETTVKAESRRLMLDHVTVPKGESLTKLFGKCA